MPELVIDRIHKRLGNNHVLRGISLDLNAGEVVALLGHSGCGKSTMLRSVAGLERPDKGRIILKDRPVFDADRGIDVPPESRGLGLVFQSYALWPNRSVFDNIAYGLKLRREGRPAIERQVGELLARLGLTDLAERYPHQLSGGQQQRVALARALAYRPSVILLDEPLSNLDAKLREEARVWLRQIIVEGGISALYVTHDQVEAMALADRLLLLHEGEVEQEGKPQDLYERPRTARAANFMGANNRIDGVLRQVENGFGRIEFADGSWTGRVQSGLAAGSAVTAFIRIEWTRLADGPGNHRLLMKLEAALYLGERWEYVLQRGPLRVRIWGDRPLPPGDAWVEFAPEHVWIF